ncbi:hypothetical protein TNCV_341831 [Trichonephila clavipes]|nr:hypothetical protein TNCV_341831 [Trichonephila clavipes]
MEALIWIILLYDPASDLPTHLAVKKDGFHFSLDPSFSFNSIKCDHQVLILGFYAYDQFLTITLPTQRLLKRVLSPRGLVEFRIELVIYTLTLPGPSSSGDPEDCSHDGYKRLENLQLQSNHSETSSSNSSSQLEKLNLSKGATIKGYILLRSRN